MSKELKIGYYALACLLAFDSLVLLGLALTADPAKFRGSPALVYGFSIIASAVLAGASVWLWRRASK